MVEIKKQLNFLDKRSRKAKTLNMSSKSNSKLTKNGQIFKNPLLDVDTTDQYRTNKKVYA